MKWLYGILCLFFLVLIHEFGHFIAAKLFKVKVESFSFGFGPVLLHKTWKGTDWRLSAFPLGGYCGMKGEKDFQKAIENNIEISGDSDSLFGIHPAKRALVGFAGPFFNFILAVIAFTIINMIAIPFYSYSNKIILADEIYPELKSAARTGGLLTGDEIISINKKSIKNFSDILEIVTTNPDEDLKITVVRDGQEKEFLVHSDMDKEDGTGKIGVTVDTSTRYITETETFPFFQAFIKGIQASFEVIELTIKGIRSIFKGAKLQHTVSGLVHTTDFMGSTIKSGFAINLKTGIVSVLEILAYISVSLCFMNLLPFPVLDGGMVLIAIIETLTRKKIPAKIQYYTQFIGIAFIAVLFILAISSDFVFYLKK